MDYGARLYFAAAAFLATHFVSSTPLRGALAGATSEKAYIGQYSVAYLPGRSRASILEVLVVFGYPSRFTPLGAFSVCCFVCTSSGLL